MVSHDRYLIEACADQLWVVANQTVTTTTVTSTNTGEWCCRSVTRAAVRASAAASVTRKAQSPSAAKVKGDRR